MRLTSMTLCLLAATTFGCNPNTNDDTGGGDTSSGSSGGTTGPGTDTTDGPTSTPTTDTGVESTVTPTTEGPDTTTTGVTTTDGPDTTEGSSGSSSTGEASECDAIVEGMVEPELFVSGFEGSEDLAFDGKGGLALKRLGDIVVVRADMSETTLLEGVPPAYGTRFLADGRLLVALPQAGKVIAVDPDGSTSDFLQGTQGANGLYPDLDGDVWITEFGGDKVLRVGMDMMETAIIEGNDAASANGVVFDTERRVLFYTRYQAGEVMRSVIDLEGIPTEPEVIAEIDGAPDGLTLDACGNLYVVDQGNDRVFRVLLDEIGKPLAEPSLLAEFPRNVANAQFGVGEGFDDHTLYVAGNPGDVYMVKLEVAGAPIVTVQ